MTHDISSEHNHCSQFLRCLLCGRLRLIRSDALGRVNGIGKIIHVYSHSDSALHRSNIEIRKQFNVIIDKQWVHTLLTVRVGITTNVLSSHSLVDCSAKWTLRKFGKSINTCNMFFPHHHCHHHCHHHHHHHHHHQHHHHHHQHFTRFAIAFVELPSVNYLKLKLVT